MSKPLKCSKCGVVDKSSKTHVGTSVVMRCKDCCTKDDPHATMCRNCCPTKHGTDWNR